ncbi:helix-turn-helix domain-containing protein [Halovulum dunhuangense]|uniref:Helix-turn-helix domain-containing protein n=1 Tax=Halovulum dunhuangense TaxID=1505036 RepID=A0A849L2M0_9RHOB|nr:helix-turn-helix domain-containing protein [Halovulum dunhuangense]
MPPAVSAYLAHTEGGLPIRAIARIRQVQPSTILRQIRRIESRREDPLLDAALDLLAEILPSDTETHTLSEDWAKMIENDKPQTREIEREARRILRRLCEKDAFLAVADGMEKAAVLRESVPGRHTRTAVVDREVAHQFALRDWIACAGSGRIARYTVTEAGRAALKRLLAEERQARSEADPVVTPFRAQHQDWGERRVMRHDGRGETQLRCNLAESPLTMLGRKRDRDGTAYLAPELVDAGERLREDFELAQMGPRVTQNWNSFLTPCDGPSPIARGPAEGPAAARARVQAAFAALGPGLSDVAFRVCCFLEGLETAEKRLGWSARSGKVVLRIALERLAMHYGMARPAQAPMVRQA